MAFIQYSFVAIAYSTVPFRWIVHEVYIYNSCIAKWNEQRCDTRVRNYTYIHFSQCVCMHACVEKCLVERLRNWENLPKFLWKDMHNFIHLPGKCVHLIVFPRRLFRERESSSLSGVGCFRDIHIVSFCQLCCMHAHVTNTHVRTNVVYLIDFKILIEYHFFEHC